MSSIIETLADRARGAFTGGQAAELARFSQSTTPNTSNRVSGTQPAQDSRGLMEKQAMAIKLIEGLKQQTAKGLPLKLETSTTAAIIDALLHSKSVGLDDRKFLLEHVLTLMSNLPEGSRAGPKLEDAVISLLYNDLPHPPSAYLGKGNAYRRADGGGNNLLFPDLGRAGTPYARSVPSSHPTPANVLPDSGLIFDTLLKRRGNTPHPAGISSFMFAFATVLIHSLFRTDPHNTDINGTSSYLDLSPLYGHNQQMQDTVRKKDGRGKLFEDSFAEQRTLFQPPAVSALLVLFSRNHNYIATKILQINERGNLSDPPPIDQARLLAQDDEIFNKARLVNCGFFMQIILSDYLSAILGTVRQGTAWSLNPLEEIRLPANKLVPRGEGNVVSVEFNLIYRWHSIVSGVDEKWTENLFRDVFPGKSWNEITPVDFVRAARSKGEELGQQDVKTWTFGGLKRGPDGRFNDNDLAKLLQDATENVSSAFKARGIPEVLRVIEILGVEQARRWGVCTMNEFRRFMGLRAFTSFKEWNSDEDVARAAERLYEHIDNLELYPGLMAEEAKPVIPGAGLCPGYTISRAILADAVSLTRGDRFLTTDFTPFNLSSWGFQDCVRDPYNGSFGGMLGKLIFRTLPDSYPERSVYAHFPFLTPGAIRENLTNIGIANKYDFDRPVMRSQPKSVDSFHGVNQVLNDTTTFKTIYLDHVQSLMTQDDFFIASENPDTRQQDAELVSKAFYAHGAVKRYAGYYLQKTRELIEKNSFEVSTASFSVNIVRDVINLVPVHWVSTEIAGLSLKTTSSPHGTHTAQEIYQMMADVYSFIFLNYEPGNAWFLREKAIKAARPLQLYIKDNLERIAGSAKLLSMRRLRHSVQNWFPGGDNRSDAFLKILVDSGSNIDELTYNVFRLVVTSVVSFAHAMSLVVNFYLDEERRKERENIIELTHSEDPNSDDLLMGYIREALRHDPQVPGIFRDVDADVEVMEGSGVPTFQAQRGDRLFVSLTKANLDPVAFPDPEAINPRRKPDSYSVFDIGDHMCLENKLAEATMPQMLRAIFGLKNVRRGPGQSGKLIRFTQDLYGTRQALYVNEKGAVSPWPTSMIIQYDI